MPSGGAGRGQGQRPVPKTLNDVADKLARLADTLERGGAPVSTELTLAAVRLHNQVHRVLTLIMQPE